MKKRDELINYLKNMYYKNLLQLYRECNGYDGSFDFCNIWDIEELCYCYNGDCYNLVRAVIYGNVEDTCDYVRFNGCGNLESVDEYDLEIECNDYIEDLADWLIDNYHNIDYQYYDLDFLDNEDD